MTDTKNPFARKSEAKRLANSLDNLDISIMQALMRLHKLEHPGKPFVSENQIAVNDGSAEPADLALAVGIYLRLAGEMLVTLETAAAKPSPPLTRLSRDDTEHGKAYYLASDVDALLASATTARPANDMLLDLLDSAREVLEIIVHDQPPDVFRNARALIPELRARLGMPQIINFTIPPATQPAAPLTDEPDDGLAANHPCEGRMVHLPVGEQCDKCGCG